MMLIGGLAYLVGRLLGVSLDWTPTAPTTPSPCSVEPTLALRDTPEVLRDATDRGILELAFRYGATPRRRVWETFMSDKTERHQSSRGSTG